MAEILDLTTVFPASLVKLFYKETLTELEEAEIDRFYTDASPETLARIDAFIVQLEQDDLKEKAALAKGEGIFFKTPTES